MVVWRHESCRHLARGKALAKVSRWRCPACGYTYDEQAGHPHEGFPPGTPFAQIPEDWPCPDCGVRDKVDFEQVPEEQG